MATIDLVETETQTKKATRVTLMMNVAGQKHYWGNAALEKSVEIKAALDAMRAHDSELEVSIEHIHINGESGWLSKTSTADIELAITVKNLSKLPEILGVVSEMKNVQLRNFEWDYDTHAAHLSCLKEAVRKVREKAEIIALGLRQKVVGIEKCTDTVSQGRVRTDDALAVSAAPRLARARSAVQVDVGVPIIAEQSFSCTVHVIFTTAAA